ncbi:MAG: HAD family hydrolase [Pseudomonadota bacterium]
MTPDLIIFDCDGVLIDSELISCGADAAALTKAGFPMSRDDVVRRFSGVPHKDMYAAIEAEFGRKLPQDFQVRVAQSVRDQYRTELQAVPGVHDTLARLTVPYCVASSSEPPKLRLGLSETGLLQLFEPHVYSASQVKRGKPAPDIFLFSAAQFGVASEYCVVVEDSVAGVTAAKAANMRVVGFAGGSHCGADHGRKLLATGAETVFERFDALPDIVEQLP